MTTDKLLKSLFSTELGYKVYNINRNTWETNKRRFETGTLGIKAKEKFLIACGFEKKEDWVKSK